MKHIMRETGPDSNVTGEDRGWRNYPPRILYRHVMLDVLTIWENPMKESAGFNVRAIQSEVGLYPFSIEEFNDTFAQEYDGMLTEGRDKLTAIVFLSTPSDKNRWGHW